MLLSDKDRDLAKVYLAIAQLGVSDTNIGRKNNAIVAQEAHLAFERLLRNEYPREDLSSRERFGKLSIE